MKSKIDFQEIIKLLNLIEERKLTDFELEVEGFRIKISKGQSSVLPRTKIASSETTDEVINKPVAIQEQKKTENNNLHYITSPMVGTFYRAPNPTAPSYVEIGETVKKNQVLCIIEAMKLMNEIESDVDGVVEEILVQNGKPVEYGQKLFAIKPNS